MSDHPFYQAPYGKGPLQGLRVLEATQAVAGPMAGTILGDLGAEVIRCELPGRGDVIRPIPPCLDPDQPLESGTWYQSVNRGKKAVTLDIRKPEGQELFRQLAAKVDVVIENFVPGTMPAWGLDYASLKAVNPGLIYLSISGFGLWGPLAKRRGMDSVVQAMSGMMSVTGEAGGRPLITGMPIVDHITGWQGAIGILAALAHREKTGKGQQVDVSLADTALAVSDHQLMSTVNTDFVGQLKGNGTPQGGPADTYVCKDGRSVFIFALLDAMWRRFCEVIERPDLIDDSRCKSVPARAKNREFVDGIVGEWTAKRTSFEVEEILEGAG
ncbi:MAG: CoA transferase, partial [Gammaproteobacteria bacterium]|nr:CoA transferase [Gammaproteobacteria bacterium]